MHTIHLLAYKYDGDGLKACEVLSEILFMLAQVGTGRHLRYLLGQCPLDDLSSMPPVATSGYGSGDSDIPAHIDSSGLYTPAVQDWGARLDATRFESLRSNIQTEIQMRLECFPVDSCLHDACSPAATEDPNVLHAPWWQWNVEFGPVCYHVR